MGTNSYLDIAASSFFVITQKHVYNLKHVIKGKKAYTDLCYFQVIPFEKEICTNAIAVYSAKGYKSYMQLLHTVSHCKPETILKYHLTNALVVLFSFKLEEKFEAIYKAKGCKFMVLKF